MYSFRNADFVKLETMHNVQDFGHDYKLIPLSELFKRVKEGIFKATAVPSFEELRWLLTRENKKTLKKSLKLFERP
jgi:hypothetical protein